jgi:hypothetical protein
VRRALPGVRRVTGGLTVVVGRLVLVGLGTGVACAALVVRHLLCRTFLGKLVRLFSFHADEATEAAHHPACVLCLQKEGASVR